MFATEGGLPVALWIDTPALGDTIAAIPTLRKLSQTFDNKPLTVFTSKPFMFEGHPLVHQAIKDNQSMDGYKVYRTFQPLVGKGYDLMGDRVEFRYSNMDLRQFHAVSLGFTLTEAEMDMDLYIESERDLGFKNYVMIHPTHTWPTRTWDSQKWQELVDRLNAAGIPVVAVGRDAKETGFYNTDKPVMDINIKLGLNLLNDPDNDPAQLRWMMNHAAKAVVTMDSGILHVAGTTDVNIIQLGSSIDNKLRAPYRNGSQDYKYQFVRGGCGIFCSSNMKYNSLVHGSIHGVPPQVKCLEDKPTFECHPTVDQVYEAVLKLYGPGDFTREKKKRAFITHTTDNYEGTTINLVNSLRASSNEEVIVYTIDYTASDALKSIATCVRLDCGIPNLEESDFTTGKIQYVNRESIRTYLALSAKIDAMLDVSTYVDEWVYLDGDCLVNNNIDDLFNYSKTSHYPLATLGPQQYVMMVKDGQLLGNPFSDEYGNGRDNTKCLEWPLMEHLGVSADLRSNNYKTTNVLAGGSQCIKFLTEWKELKDTLPSVLEMKKYMPFHEETIYNVMVWADGDQYMPMVYINIEGPETVEHFFNNTTEEDVFITPFYKLPADKSQIRIFHGEKRTEEANTIIEMIKQRQKPRLLYLAPHASTGGMPQFLLKRVEAMLQLDEFEVHVLEYNQYSTDFTVQRSQLINLLGNRFQTIAHLGSITDEARAERMKEILLQIKPDIIHIEESPEAFDSFNKVPKSALKWLYSQDRPWRIVETCHNIWFKDENKQWLPEAFMYCTPYHPTDNFKNMKFMTEGVVQYPIEDLRPSKEAKVEAKRFLDMDPDKIHVLNTGLWTAGKNQKEGVEIARIAEEQHPGKFQFHFVGNQASNFSEYWQPIMENLPTNVTIWYERNDVNTFMTAADAFMFNSTWECSPLALREAISHGLITFTRNLPQYMDTFTPYIVPFSDELSVNADILLQTLTSSKELLGDFTPPKDDFLRFMKQHKDIYNSILALGKQEQTLQGPKFRLEYQNGLKLYADALSEGQWSAEFWDGSDLIYTATGLEEGHWYSPARKWHTDWLVKVLRNGIYEQELRWTLNDRDVLVQFDSSSLGDTLAWMGQMIRFKQHHGIRRLQVRTHKNWLFDREYYLRNGVELVDDWTTTPSCYYTVGVYFDEQEPWRRWEHKYDWRTVTLAKIATDRLGIEHQEARPKLAREFRLAKSSKYSKKHVVIATQSTAQAKYWNNPTGWQDLAAWYNSQEIEVYHSSKEGAAPQGTIQLGESLEEVAACINSAEHFVGISSGLSWFAWALDKHVILISGFTDPYVEFQTNVSYINNHQFCHGCWGFRVFERGDWNWCPDWKGTARQFECSKKISAEQVIEQANSLLVVNAERAQKAK
jgi:autotransporter strand-loop-strand O-heptosyltransferase